MSEFRGIPPGPNVGTQLKALRRKQKAAKKAEQAQQAEQLEKASVSTSDNSEVTGTSVTDTAARPPLAELKQADIEAWFATQGWAPFEYQQQVWRAFQKGHSGLLHATTGAGKTLAVWLGALLRMAQLYSKDPKHVVPPRALCGLRPCVHWLQTAPRPYKSRWLHWPVIAMWHFKPATPIPQRVQPYCASHHLHWSPRLKA